MRSLFDGSLPNKRPKIFALDGSQGNCNVFTFFRNFRRHGVDMENGIEPKRTISLNWDVPWKKYEEKWRKNPRGEGKTLLFTDFSRT